MGEIRRLDRDNEFGKIYEIICDEKCVSPLSTIQAHLTENRLKFCCDRVNYENWSPILNALAADQSLLEIYAYSRNRTKKISESIDTEKKLDEYRKCIKTSSRGPIIYTNFLLRCFVDAVAVCSRDSRMLKSLILDGIPLVNAKYLDILSTGLSFNRNIQNISLARCKIGDSGCELILRALLENPNLRVIDFTSCLLTSKSAHTIASFLRKRRTKLLKNEWQESIDNGDTDTKQFQGVQTLILNKNRKFGDEGLRTLVDTLKDDYWLKSLSVRRCGLTKNSGNVIIDLLGTNSVIVNINFKDNKLPIAMIKTTRRLFRRRLEKNERIPLRRRLVDRKKYLRLKRSHLSIGKSEVNRRLASKRVIIVKNRRDDGFKVINDETSNLRQLKERLSKLIGCNRKLTRGLSNQRRLIVGEKSLRINAEQSYRSMIPVIEKLRYGSEKQNRIRSRLLFENHLCTDIRRIFRDLERISGTNARSIEAENPEKNVSMEKVIMKKSAIDTFEESRKIIYAAQRRPHCPQRKRVQKFP